MAEAEDMLGSRKEPQFRNCDLTSEPPFCSVAHCRRGFKTTVPLACGISLCADISDTLPPRFAKQKVRQCKNRDHHQQCGDDPWAMNRFISGFLRGKILV